MTTWKEIKHQVLGHIKNEVSSILVVRQLGLRKRILRKAEQGNKRKTKKPKKEIYPEELIAIIASIIIIFIAYGALGFVYDAYAFT
ncbi:MAG: hypothetical protein ACRD5J_16230 [Nitrososphaeraceae archaeon]